MNKLKSSNSRTKAKNKYNNTNYTQLNLRLPPKIIKGLKIYCNNIGISKRQFIIQLICEKIERDTGKSFEEFLQEKETSHAQLDESSYSKNDISLE